MDVPTCCLRTSEDPVITAKQLRLGRALLEMSQKRFAEIAEVSVPTIQRLESQSGELRGLSTTIQRIEKTLEEHGVLFVEGGAFLKSEGDQP